MSRVFLEYLKKASETAASGEHFVGVTLVQPEGHVPQDIGAKAIVTKSGLLWGTVGGGRLEARAITMAQDLLAENKGDSLLCRLDLQQDLGMACGGIATLFFEVVKQESWNIAVFGAGHVAQAVVPLLSTFDCKLFCIDHRKDWIDKMPNATNLQKIHTDDVPALVWELPKDTFYVVITQGLPTDLPVVRQILKRKEFAYLGVIGSSIKAKSLRATLLQEGLSREEVRSFHCPIGLPFGTNSPAEIAVSIAAQILQVRDFKPQSSARSDCAE